MQFDEFDNKIKDAADHHHPAYDDQAWTRMEKLLDKHLPQQEDNRRRFLVFILLLLGIGGILFLAIRPRKTNRIDPETNIAKQQEKKDNVPAGAVPDATTGLPGMHGITDPVNVNVPVDEITANYDPGQQSAREKSKKNPSSNNNKGQWLVQSGTGKIAKQTGISTTVTEPPKTAGKENDNSIARIVDNTVSSNSPVTNDKEPAKNPTPATLTTANKATPAIPNQTAAVEKSENEKSKAKKKNAFFFTLSAGPDISFAATNKPGTTKIIAGAGLGYTFNDRVTIRTGFYSVSKVYTASPAAYHPPGEFYIYYPYLENVAANCKVYEIPLTASYHFNRSAKQSFFASAGVTSYLMKKETYDYSYKYSPSGQTHKASYTLENKNQHYFSGLSFSAGYERKIGKHISLVAEPYIKLPVTGIGYGKVKLNSAGVLFTVAIKPFK